MATLTLRKTFVNLVATGESVSGQSAPGRQPVTSVDRETRTYAGGRQRAITREGVRGSYSTVLRLLTRTQVDTLASWQGQLVQVRDDRGRRVFGTYDTVAEVERKGTPLYDVPLTVEMVTFNEGV